MNYFIKLAIVTFAVISVLSLWTGFLIAASGGQYPTGGFGIANNMIAAIISILIAHGLIKEK